MEKRICLAVVFAGFTFMALLAMMFMVQDALGEQLRSSRPDVDVVFCLDTTGSMSGLIEGAKQKIWSIANRIVEGKPTPALRIGLVGYRDKGDEYVTKVFDLDDDLDTVYENLMSFAANGGGDTPEHVNKGLHDAVNAMQWNNSRDSLKLIFLVGDCPPHTDYQDGYDYKKICESAVKKDIIINTVQCGSDSNTIKYWKEIAKLGEGEYSAIAQSGGMVAIDTPMDAELSRLNSLLEGTVIAYGSDEVRKEYKDRSKFIKAMSAPIAAERAVYKSAGASYAEYDLVDTMALGKVDLEDIEEEWLPDEMKGMSIKERKSYLKEKEAEREKIKSKIKLLSKKRNTYIKSERKKSPSKDSFDSVVEKLIEKQARKKGIKY